MQTRELVIIGGGPAGMAAAIAAHQNGVKDILLLERDQTLGGILNQCIHTGFGLHHFQADLSGPEYANRFIEQIQTISSIEISLRSLAVKLTPDKVITYLSPGKLINVKAEAIILATGCREKTREMIPLPGDRPAGIFPAGLAQKMINLEGWLPGKEIVVVGSGDIGLIMARRFTLEGANVKAIIEIQKQSRGLMRNLVQCVYDFDIPLYFQHKIKKIIGKNRVEKVVVVAVDERNIEKPGSTIEINCDTLLISVGLIPENELLGMAGGKLDQNTNTPISNGINQTSIPGIFSCGNAFKVYDLVDNVTRDSFLAGKLASNYLLALDEPKKKSSAIKRTQKTN